MLDQCCNSAGPMLDQCWTNVVVVLDQCWTNAGWRWPTLIYHWSDVSMFNENSANNIEMCVLILFIAGGCSSEWDTRILWSRDRSWSNRRQHTRCVDDNSAFSHQFSLYHLSYGAIKSVRSAKFIYLLRGHRSSVGPRDVTNITCARLTFLMSSWPWSRSATLATTSSHFTATSPVFSPSVGSSISYHHLCPVNCNRKATRAVLIYLFLFISTVNLRAKIAHVPLLRHGSVTSLTHAHTHKQ